MPTPHNTAEKGQIAPVVLMPGDPLRAKYIAETYLDDPKLFNEVRCMYGYTGTYDGAKISVMGSGMGMPSIAIYSWELFTFYGVDTIIRVGSSGGLAPQAHLRDLVIAQAASTNSNMPNDLGLPGTIAPIADFYLLRSAVDACERNGVDYHVGNILSTDTFYCSSSTSKAWAEVGTLAVEMEACALYLNAQRTGRHALCITTVSDLPLTGEELSAEERETSFAEMMEVALEVAAARSREL